MSVAALGTIIPPILPPGIGGLVCKVERALSTLFTLYTTMPKLPDREGLHVCDFLPIERKCFHAALQETDWVGTIT